MFAGTIRKIKIEAITEFERNNPKIKEVQE